MSRLLDISRDAVMAVPSVQPLLGLDALKAILCEVKTLEYFRANITHMVRSVYGGNMGGEFVDLMGNLITGQMRDAITRAWSDEDGEGPLPAYLQDNLAAVQGTQVDFDWIYQYYKDIVDARVDNTPVAPLLSRADLWANRYNEAYNGAVQEITMQNGGKLVWQLGATEQHCGTCAALNGIVAFAHEWTTSGIKPQNAPNSLLECGGWQCDCSLVATDKRRSPKALDRLMNIAVSRSL